MSTVPAFIFPRTSLVLNELEAVTQPSGVHAKHLMLLCNQQEVSSLTELKQTLPRSIWPQLRTLTEFVDLYEGLFFDNVASGVVKYSVPSRLSVDWAGTPQHNLFRIGIVLSDALSFQYVTEEIIKEQGDYWINLLRLRLEYYANIAESVLLYRLLTERAVPLSTFPRSYMGLFANLASGVLQAEAGTENIYIMLNILRFVSAMRQSPMRLGSAGYLIFNQETPKFNIIPVALRPRFAPFSNFAVGYGDYLVKTTTRYYINKFRVEENRQIGSHQNYYKVMYERYVSYTFPILTGTGNTNTWAFIVDVNNTDDATTNDDLGAALGGSDVGFLFTATHTAY